MLARVPGDTADDCLENGPQRALWMGGARCQENARVTRRVTPDRRACQTGTKAGRWVEEVKKWM